MTSVAGSSSSCEVDCVVSKKGPGVESGRFESVQWEDARWGREKTMPAASSGSASSPVKGVCMLPRVGQRALLFYESATTGLSFLGLLRRPGKVGPGFLAQD